MLASNVDDNSFAPAAAPAADRKRFQKLSCVENRENYQLLEFNRVKFLCYHLP